MILSALVGWSGCAHKRATAPHAEIFAAQLAATSVDNELCRGTAIACEAIRDCTTQDGCLSDSLNRCGGQPVQCTAFITAAACAAQQGCTWGDGVTR